jgi:predicted enzyme related to lactoylglutathione lyase
MANKVVHWEIMGKDAKELQTFYADMFDWNIDADNEYQYGMVDTAEIGVGGGIGGDPSQSQRVSIFVEVDDLQAYLDKATRLGGTMVMPPTDIAGVSFAMFADPSGNVTGLLKSDNGTSA